MHHDGCKTRLSQWTSAILGPLTMDEEEEETLGEEGANITTNPPTASRTMPRAQGTLQMPAFNVDKQDTMPENALKDNNAPETTGKIKQLI